MPAIQIRFFDDPDLARSTETYVRNWFAKKGFAVLSWKVLNESSSKSGRPFVRSDETLRVECELRGNDVGKQKAALQAAWCSDPVRDCPPSLQPWLCIAEDHDCHSTDVNFDQKVYLRCALLGTLPWPSAFVTHQRIPTHWNPDRLPRAHFKHNVKQFDVIFRAPCGVHNVRMPNECKLQILYSSIRRILVTKCLSGSGLLLIFALVHPPLVLYEDVESSGQPSHDGTTWQRVLNPSDIPLEVFGMTSALALSIPNARIARYVVAGLQSECRNVFTHYVSAQVTSKWLPFPSVDLGHFGCTYMLMGMLLRNNVLALQNHDRPEQLFEELGALASEAPAALEKALAEALRDLDAGRLVDYRKLVMKRFRHHRDTDAVNCNLALNSRPENCVLVRRAILTPSRILLWPPEDMFSNRVLRNFDPDYALRVSFREENMNKLNHLSYAHDKSVFDSVIEYPMTEGLHLGPRHYQFLAWSDSQLRDHGTWMYAPDAAGHCAASVCRWMGDFSNIRSVPKTTTCMSQCFAPTEATVFVPSNSPHVVIEPEILGCNNPNTWKQYCFSEGIGRISVKLAENVCNVLALTYMPSAYHIRYAGFKGMLVLDPTMQDKFLVLRDSMKTFECNDDKLEIVKTSGPCHIQLNRSLITILDQMGIPSENLLRIQEAMFLTVTDLLLDEHKAAEYLTNQTPLEKMDFKALAADGISLTAEPFFRGMLMALHNRDLVGMRKKACLSVDPALGRKMFGVLDETGILQYGQVFVQYSTDLKMPHGLTAVVKGPVLVTKYPCLQPGDVRVLEAVDVLELHHIVDCIAFPQKGPRPHPDEMNGSFLEGDEYTVIWDLALLCNTRNYPARNLPYTMEEKLNGNITAKDMISFLCRYVEKDQLEQIGEAHLAQADQVGLSSVTCQGLAQKFSVAMDFANTGRIDPLQPQERPSSFPDFMETGPPGCSYHSQRVLGTIYRSCIDFERGHRVTMSPFYSDIQVDPDLVHPGWEVYRDQARIDRERYSSALESICMRYGICQESELMTGAFGELYDVYRDGQDRIDAEEMIVKAVQMLRKNTRKHFYEEFQLQVDNTGHGLDRMGELRKKASAWYVETYQDAGSPRFLGFPWCVENVLRSIKLGKRLKNRACRPMASPALSRLNAAIWAVEYNLPELELPLTPHLGGHAHVSSTVKRTLGLVILWARNSGLSEVVDRAEETLAKVFLHVASKSREIQQEDVVGFTGVLFVSFLRFCSSLRFRSETEVGRILSFRIHDRKELARRCMQAYHGLAMSGGSLEVFLNTRTDR